MPTTRDTLDALISEVAKVLAPLSTELQSDRVLGFIRELGLQLPASVNANAGLVQAFGQVGGCAARLPGLVSALETANAANDSAAKLSNMRELAGAVVDLFRALRDLENELSSANIAGISAADIQAFAFSLARKLADYLIIRYIEDYHPVLFGIGSFMGVIEKTLVPADPAVTYERSYYHHEIHFDRIPRWLEPSGTLFADLYDWNTAAFTADKLVIGIQRLLYCISVPATIQPPVSDDIGPALLFGPFRLRAGPGFNPPGVDVVLRAAASQLGQLMVPLWGDSISLKLIAEGAIEASTGIRVLPPANVEVIPPAAEFSGKLGIGLIGRNGDGSPISLIQGFGLSWSAQEIGVDVTTSLAWDSGQGSATGNYAITGSLNGCIVGVAPDDPDGFIAKILPSDGLRAEFGLQFGYASDSGLFLVGSSTIELHVPIHLSLGPITVDGLMVAFGQDPNGLRIEAATTVACTLGPLNAVVDGIGLISTWSEQAEGGNLGSLDVQLGFRPPIGVGLSLDAGAVKGGGFLYCDPDRGEYAGIAQLSIVGLVTVTAIGIITTRMPDGSVGFSLLLIMSVSFEPGIQLGYGFTLSGLGGIIGLNRTMVGEALAQGVRTGTVNDILFPVGDIIPQAPRIISDLRAIFPPEDGHFLIGPMVKIGWGTPTLISVSMGVIIEIPGSFAIIGVIRCALPTQDLPILNLQVCFIGVVDPAKGQLYFFAGLFESKLLTMTLEGEAGLLLAWGDDPNFVISVGGFHPRFDPPPLPFPIPARLALSILDEDFGRIRLEAYFAITSNTAQFGAAIDVWFGYDEFCLAGDLSFDALIQFSPFQFVAEMSGNLTLEVFGFDACSIHIDIELTGPTPWKAHVEGSISALCFEYTVNFSEQWGRSENTDLPSIAVLPLFSAEVEKLENWRTVLPASNNQLVSVRDLSDSSGDPVLHPAGILRFSQRLMPVGITIDLLGNQEPNDISRVDISSATAALVRKGGGQERFAMAQFIDLSNDEKLSRPAYELEDAGIELGSSDDLRTSHAAYRHVRYEETWIDDVHRDHLGVRKNFDRGLFGHFLGSGAINLSALSAKRKRQMNPFADAIKARDTARYFVADADTNTPFANTSPSSYTKAEQAMERAVANDPALSGRLVLIPETEILS